MDSASPEQRVWVEGVTVTTGIGFTVTEAVIGSPEQLFAIGVMVYTTDPGAVVVADKIWLILVPLPDDAPDALVCAAVQAKLVIGVPLLSWMGVMALAEQTGCEAGTAAATGRGLITNLALPLRPEGQLGFDWKAALTRL